MSITTEQIFKTDIYETELDQVSFERLAMQLGTPIASRKNGNLVDVLIPKAQHQAHPNSLSALNGLDEFPFHTDGAYFQVPPRYIALRYNATVEGQTPTLFLPFLDSLTRTEKSELKREMWQVRGRVNNFYASVISTSANDYLRFDTTCMSPVGKSSAVSSMIASKIKTGITKTVDWYPDKVVVFDNWRWLHARPQVVYAEIKYRSLQRIMIHV